jgi:hypothetical protein
MARRATRWLPGVFFTLCACLAPSIAVPADGAIPTAELAPYFRGGKDGYPYTLAMLELGMRTGAATTAVLRGEPERARAALKSLREQMNKVGAMVPSWSAQFRTPVIAEMEQAVASRADLATRRKLVARLEAGCTDCHARTMFQVQALYKWGSFADASISTDAGSISFHQVMLDLATDLGAVRADVESGHFQEAQVAYKRLMERFGQMEQLCANCHDQPRQYFIDSAVKARLFKIGGLLRRGDNRVSEYAPLFRDVNESSCLPCHQVHMPAAFQQRIAAEARR